jgi:hypothetical protein
MNPLAELKDIVLPEQIHNYPLAAGWWILLILAVVSIIYGISVWRKRKLLNVNKAKALAALAKLELSLEPNQDSSQEPQLDKIVAILKWSALAYFPRQQVANLYGRNLQTFMLSTLPSKFHNQFNNDVGEILDHLYSPSNSQSAQEFNNAAQLWVKHALPPKAEKNVTQIALGGKT